MQDGGVWELARNIASEIGHCILGKDTAFWGLGIGSPETGSSGSSSNSSPPNAGSDSINSSNNTGESKGGPEGAVNASKTNPAQVGEAGSCSSSLPIGKEDGNRKDSSSSCSSGSSSGDPGGRLPAPDHSRLVGVKVPSAPCVVTCTVPKYEEEGFLVL
eukprot:scaffold124025_cov16-Tisochrysis_lutea.AAC.1